MIPSLIRQGVLNRAWFRCERCGSWLNVAAGAYSLQHRVARGMGGTRRVETPSVLAALCGSATTGCHGYVESHPAEALEDGWRVPQGHDPAKVPIVHWERGRVLLTDLYDYEPAEAAA